MDYMPIRLGFANCQDLTPKNAKGVVIRQGGQTIDLGDLFVETSTLMGKGGQIKGKESRCFASSLKHLVEIASGDTSYTRAGVCYRANCPTPDVLQFGLQGASGEYWYQASRRWCYITTRVYSIYIIMVNMLCYMVLLTVFALLGGI